MSQMKYMNKSVIFSMVLLAIGITHQSIFAQFQGPVRATIGGDAVEMGSGKPPVNNKKFPHPAQEWQTIRWSWIHWWEANAHRFLKPAKWDTGQPREGFDLAETALLKALQQNKNPKVIAEVVWASGRMKSTDATSKIVELLKHPDEIVRRNSWLSLGLIEDDLAIKTINDVLAKPDLEPEDAAAWIVAIGLMDKPNAKLLKAMIPIIKQKNITRALAEIPSQKKCWRNEAMLQARMAMWTLRMHHPKGIRQFAQQLMSFTTDPILFDEAIQTIAASPTEQIVLKLFNPIYHSRLRDYLKLPKVFSIDGYGAYAVEGFSHMIGPDFPNGLPSIRASAAFAYNNTGIVTHSKRGRLVHLVSRQLARSYTQTERYPMAAKHEQKSIKRNYKFDSWRKMPRNVSAMEYKNGDIGVALRLGLIPLGNLGDTGLDAREDPVHAQLLCDVLLGKYTEPAQKYRDINQIYNHPPAIDGKHDPSRGYAAIALGLYTRRMPADLHSIRHHKTKDIARYIERLLTRTAKNNDEPSILRAACALALGLGGSTTANEQLVSILQDSPPPLVSSYAILALGILQDPVTLKLAKQAFKKTSDQIDVKQIQTAAKFKKEGILKTQVQRVLVQSLACISEPLANKMLYPYLTDNPYTSREMIRVFKWSNDTTATAPLLELLEKPGNKKEHTASFCAWALGELYDSTPYSKAHQRLLLNRNFTLIPIERNTQEVQTESGPKAQYLRKIQTQPYLQLTNLFLFEAMITNKIHW